MTYPSACGVTGTGVVVRHHDGSLAWQQADPEIHVTAEVLADVVARDQVEKVYDVGDWCDEAKAFHARRKATS